MGEKSSMQGLKTKEPEVKLEPKDYPVKLIEPPKKNATEAQKMTYDLRLDYVKNGHNAIAYLLPDSALLRIEIYFEKKENGGYHNGMNKNDYLTTLDNYLRTNEELIYEDHMALNEYARGGSKPTSIHLVIEGKGETEEERSASRMIKAREFIDLFTPVFGKEAFGKPIELNEKSRGKDRELVERLKTRHEMAYSTVSTDRENLGTLQNAPYPMLTGKDKKLSKMWVDSEKPLLLDKLGNLCMFEALVQMRRPGATKEENDKRLRENQDAQTRLNKEAEDKRLAIAGILAAVVKGIPSKLIPPTIDTDVPRIIDDLKPGDKWWEDKAAIKDIQLAVLAEIKKGLPKSALGIVDLPLVDLPSQSQENVDELAEELKIIKDKLKADLDKTDKELKEDLNKRK